MSIPSLFAILFAPAHLPRRRVFAPWLPALVIALAGLLGSSLAQATVYTFNGSTDVYGCSRSGTVYTCPNPAYLNADDGIIINSGVTVRVTNNVIVKYGQFLQMSGTAKLIVTGYLDLSAINPANLRVSGGTIDVGGTMTVGDIAQSLTANIIAGAVEFGPDRVSITGTIVSRGAVNLSAYSKITAPGGSTALSGTVITTGAGVSITGNVLASSSLTMGSGSSIAGNVDTGNLMLQASNATITGDASVNWATLEQGGRVTGTIYCKNGTGRNKCDCVTNNSGYQVNKNNGPSCESLQPKGPHHFLITHDGVGDTCVPEKITVLACANATCTAPHYTAGVSGTLGPFGTAFSIPVNASTTVVDAIRTVSGTATLEIPTATPQPQWADVCYNDVKRTNSCAMEFIGGAKLLLGPVGSHIAGESKTLAIKAVKQSADQSACVTAFGGATYDVQYRCDYSKPKTGTVALTLNGNPLTCNAAAGTIQTRSTTFNGNGEASLPLLYADAGELDLSGSINTGKGITANGNTSFITAPKEFELVKPAGPLRAGADFSVTIRARNANGAVTKNFDTDGLNGAGASGHTVALDVACRAQAGEPGTLSTRAITFRDGEASVTTSWSEVGKIELEASLTSFLGGGVNVAGTTRGTLTSCPGNVGPFVPAYFELSRADARPSYYSGEPIELKVSAMGAGGAPTRNYAHALGLSETVTLAAVKQDGTAFALPAPGALAPATVAAETFINGLATVKPAYTFTAYPNSPLQIRLRASNGKTGALEVVSSAPASAEAQVQPFIRSGRLRLGNRVGNLRSPLAIPVTAEYWTGRSWLINDEDDYTVIPPGAFVFTPNATGMTLQKTFAPDPFKLAKGAAAFTLQLSGGGPGWYDIASNLGSTGTDNACLGAARPASTGAGVPWLRPMVSTCSPAGRRDPAGRASFGILPPEQRRLIHVREVFN
ncbi:DUF6701 domain-containing protein [Massilia sp. H6]|uniref:DUF6701 domain-containing protein n=1 Tax=Massilia sp. H6 TaxID=2970464 RepID=UPI002166DF6E|nr:DUF6701 domain-containing protein [Massilia sp. H6]UVW28585.1 hypothetical protein NRS07_00065 [Massilia sp. H6]